MDKQRKWAQCRLVGEEKVLRSNINIDRGWAWIVMIGCFLTITISMGYIRTFGILFIEYRVHFNASATTTAFTLGLRSAIQSVTALMVHNVVLEFVSIRAVSIVGGIFYGCNVIIKVFAPNMTYVMITECILAGMAHGMVYSPTFVLLGQYFKKHRSFASSFASCGSSFGGMVFAPMLHYLLEYEGYGGALLIYGAIILNIVPCAFLFRPLKPHEILEDNDDGDDDNDDKGSVAAVMEFGSMYSLNLKIGSTNQLTLEDRFKSTSDNIIEGNVLLKENLAISLSKSSPHINHPKTLEVESIGFIKHEQKTQKNKSLNMVLMKMVQSFDLKLFTDIRFLIISAFTFFGPIATGTGGILLPPLAKEIGLTTYQSSVVLIILAAVDLVSRFCIGIIADRNWITKQNIVLLCLILLGFTCHLSFAATDFSRFVIFTVSLGIFSGSYFALLSVILIDCVGLSKLSHVLGFVQLYGGISAFISFPILGALKDVYGSYIASFHCLGICSFLSALFLILEPLVRRYKLKYQKGQSDKSVLNIK